MLCPPLDHAASCDNISSHFKNADDIKMTTVSGALNNLLEIAATPQQRPGNALATNIPKTNSRDFLRHRLHQTNKNSQKS